MPKPIFIVIAVIVVSVLIYVLSASDEPLPPPPASSEQQEKQTVSGLPTALPETIQADENAILTQTGLSPEQAVIKFRQARNEWRADPSLSEEAKEQRITALAKALWGDDADIPQETAEDRDEQARIHEQIMVFRQDADTIKTDTNLTLEEKQQAIEALIKNFVENKK